MFQKYEQIFLKNENATTPHTKQTSQKLFFLPLLPRLRARATRGRWAPAVAALRSAWAWGGSCAGAALPRGDRWSPGERQWEQLQEVGEKKLPPAAERVREATSKAVLTVAHGWSVQHWRSEQLLLRCAPRAPRAPCAPRHLWPWSSSADVASAVSERASPLAANCWICPGDKAISSSYL